MKRYLIALIISSLLIIGNPMFVKGYEGSNFSNITINEGLQQSSISSIFQDDKGYIWFAAFGAVSRYDGSKFRHFETTGKDDGIANSYVTDIGQDVEGNIWIATVDGISKIDADTEKIINYDEDEGLECTFVNRITRINNELIIFTKKGMYVYNSNEDRFDKIFINSQINNINISAITIDNDNNLWVANSKEIYKLDILNKTIS
ncbi:MAG: hypothetical protein E7214_09850 [Clostridium sp.]|nr:hypothetical protein [Clostridium sp.]